MSIVLLLTDAHEPAAEILPSLSLLSHAIRIAPASATAAADGPGADALLVDARRDLVQVRRLLRLLRSAEMNVPILAIVTEGGWAAVTADWGADDVILHTAGPGEVDARLRLAIGRRDGRYIRYRLFDAHVTELLEAIRHHGEHASIVDGPQAARRDGRARQ